MMDLSSRGLPQRPDQNPLAERRQQMNLQRQPPQVARQMAQAQALRGTKVPQQMMRGSF